MHTQLQVYFMETQNLLSVLKRKAAVYKMLLQTCAQVQERKIKSADVNKEKIPDLDFFKSLANRMGLGFDLTESP